MSKTNFDSVKIGVCDVYWVDPIAKTRQFLGLTKGGVELTYTPEFYDMTVDQYGKTPIDSVLTGETIVAKVPLAETDAKKIGVLSPTGTWDEANQATTFGQKPGLRLRDLPTRVLVLHPIFESDHSQDVTIFRSVNKGPIQLNYKIDEERVFSCEFNGLIRQRCDRTSPKDLLWRIGDAEEFFDGSYTSVDESTASDTLAPGNVTNFTAVAGAEQVSLKWTDPADVDWYATKLVRKIGSYPTAVTDGTVVFTSTTRDQYKDEVFVDTGLIDGTTYYYRAFPYDTSGNVNTDGANGVTATPVASEDNTAPGNVSEFIATPGNAQVTLQWTDPVDTDWYGTKIMRKVGDYPTNENDGILVLNSTTGNQYQSTGYVDSGLTNDTEYFYQAFPYDANGNVNRDAANQVTATPVSD